MALTPVCSLAHSLLWSILSRFRCPTSCVTNTRPYARTPTGPKAPLTALCLSGGGIRSATFALGVIQGLAERGVLSGFDYLSTVSGGRYVGGWLSSWSSARMVSTR